VVGLGNPGSRYASSRHNIGFEVANELGRRWDLPKASKAFGALVTEGRAGAGGPHVALLLPQTYMNESGKAVGPARGHYRLGLDQVLVVYDEIDLPFGEVRARRGGGLAGHNGLKSVAQGLGGNDFLRVRVGVGRPDSTDPEVVAGYVLEKFAEPTREVRELIGRAADRVEQIATEGLEEPPQGR
jgi:peptidyl-tRNA hydrolase, PTH1 family